MASALQVNQDFGQPEVCPQPFRLAGVSRKDLFVDKADCCVLTLDKSLAANEFRVSIEIRYFDAVIPEVDVVHFVPIEVLNEKQFGLGWLNEVYRVVPITSRRSFSGFLNQDRRSMRNRRNNVEKWNCTLEKVLQWPLSVNLCQHEFLKEELRDFVELFD